jgi:hypothetical protein
VDAATEAEIKSDLDRARKALQTVADAAATAADVCATPNILALFADFEQIWTDIEALITNAHVLMAMPAGARPPGVQVPAVVTLIRRSR